LKDDLRKLKGKALADDTVTSHSIAPEILNVNVEPLAPKLLNNKTVHSDYLRHTHKQAAILKEVVKQGKSQNPLNNSLDHAYKYTKKIQELLILIRQTCPSNNGSSGCDPLALVDGFTPVENNAGLLETRFDEEAVFVFMFPEDVTGFVNLTLLALFSGVTSTNLPLEPLLLGQVRIVLKCAKITKKPDNIYTRSEATKKSQIRKQVFSK
nr:hypothetical protein [Tanacetum cinerariifolium]